MFKAIVTALLMPLAFREHLRTMVETQEEQDEREFIEFCDELGIPYNEGIVLFNNVADLINGALSDEANK